MRRSASRPTFGNPTGPALYAKYEGRPGANKGRTFEGRPNLGGRLKGGGWTFRDADRPHRRRAAGPPEHWKSDPFIAIVTDGSCGRGTVDMKGGVACMLMAIETLRR